MHKKTKYNHFLSLLIHSPFQKRISVETGAIKANDQQHKAVSTLTNEPLDANPHCFAKSELENEHIIGMFIHI
jgi:hypothetical protein